jgi:hypothetical protein
VKRATPAVGVVVIAIDGDQNPATGYQGFDSMFLGDLASNDFIAARWHGSDFAATHMPTATASSDDTGLTFSIDGSELRTATGFNFFVRTIAGNSVDAGNHDDAPASGDWNYRLGGAAVLTLTVEQSTSTKARAGKPFIAFVTVARTDGEQGEVIHGDISCAATAGGRLLQATAIPTYGPAAGCSWRLPKHSKGKALRAAVTVTLDAATVTQTSPQRSSSERA